MMCTKPLVSIVVAIYRSERFLDKLITSIIEQSYRNLEIILVDDGSPDKSGEICDSYARQDRRINVIHKLNGGTCDARNKGIETATGDYLVIIDGDDWLAPDYVEYLLNLIQRPGIDMSMSDSIFTTRDLEQNIEDRVVALSPEEAVAQILYPRMAIGPWNKMYSMKMIRENHITFCTSWSGEGLYYASMAAQCSRGIAMGHRRIYYYRLNNENSGLTHHNVQIAINALENIRFIRQNLVIRTPITLNAADWHIWKNNFYLIFLIKATHSESKFREELQSSISYLRKNMFYVLSHSDINAKEKVKMIFEGLFPIIFSKYLLMKEKIARSKDQFVAKN